MSTIFIIPVTNTPQTFDIALAGTTYTVTCKFNSAIDAGWVLDFVNTVSGIAVAYNCPLITGGDILAGLEYLGINGQLFVYTDGDDTAVPTLDNLGIDSNLYFATSDLNG